MKNYIAKSGAKISLQSGSEITTVDLYSREGLDFLSNLWIKVAAEHKIMYEPTWLGRPIIQFPNDVLAIQELLWGIQPDIVIETGVAHGGSLILSASILELIGKGKVIGIDVEIREHNLAAITAHPLSHRIELIEGSSTDEETLLKVRKLSEGGKSVIVFLDSNHSEAHVTKELELYSPLVSKDSYIVAHDGAQGWVWDIPRGKPGWKVDNPLIAIDKFLEKNKQFTMDSHPTRFGITSSPRGWLKRTF